MGRFPPGGPITIIRRSRMSASVVNEDRAAVGRRIGQARRERGFTQADLASRIGGVSLGLVDRYESGKADPSEKLAQIAEVTGRPISWFTERHDGESGYEAKLPAALGRQIAESRVQLGVTRREPPDERLGAAHDEPGSQPPTEHWSPPVDPPGVAAVDREPDERTALARQRDELRVELEEERRRHRRPSQMARGSSKS